jgi:dTDP-4-dehydrorhamnose reductase
MVLGGGQVASAVAATRPPDLELIAKPRAELDIGNAAALEQAISSLKPAWIVNAAAYTQVDLAEDQPAEAKAVNDTAVGVMARAAAAHGSRLLHLSTDFVFDGDSSHAYLPGDATHPLSVYGRTKRDGESHVTDACGGIVLRTAWVYASTGKNFVLTMLRLMKQKTELSVVCDQIGAPTWATGLARAIWGLMAAKAPPGIHHWTDLGVASWYDFAVAIQEEALAAGLLHRLIPIYPIASAQYPTKATRPRFSVLDTTHTRAAIPTEALHWRQNLRTMLHELRTD